MSEARDLPDLLIVSDLHLSEGWDSQTERIDRKEDFFADDAFSRFLGYFRAKAKDEGEKKLRLVFAGDLFDFLQVTTVPCSGSGLVRDPKRETRYGLGTLPEQTVWKLNQRIVPGHWQFFEAVREFVAAGHEIVIIPGNHDIELTEHDVQAALKAELVKGRGEEGQGFGTVTVLPWFYYEPGLIFVAHGHQYDSLNSFNYFLYPRRPDGTFELPAGSFFVRYLFNRVESDYPFADNMKPASKFLGWYLNGHWRSLGQLRWYCAGLGNLLGKANPIEARQESLAKAEQEERLRSVAAKNNLSVDQLNRLKALWVPSILHAKKPRPKRLRQVALCMHLFWRGEDASLACAATRVHGILGVQYVLFGHTHTADLQQIGSIEEERCEYFNTGTWTKCFAENYSDYLLESENELTFCLYERESKKMQLMRWNDDRGEPERVKLFRRESRAGRHRRS
jgi:UDP-2,3-diacylglucosamine pyrophosphatase LpxH